MQAGHVEVNHGVLDYDKRSDESDFQDRHIPVDFSANDVSLLLKYVAGNGITQESYHLDAGVHDLRLVRGPADHPDGPPVEGYIQAAVDFTRNATYLRSLQLTAHSRGSADRVLNVTGELDDFSRPRWKTSVQGELDLKLMEPALGYPFTPEGIAKLNLAAVGQEGEFRIDGTVHADNASYIGTGVVARGVGLDARVHADPLRLQITNVTARLKAGGQMDGEVLLDHWIAPLAGAPAMQAVVEPAKHEKKGKIHEKAAPPVVVAKVDTDLHTNGKVNANFRDVTLDTLLDMVSQEPFKRLGLDARLNGLSTAAWNNGDVNTLAMTTKFDMSPSTKRVAGEAPTSGVIDGTYQQRNGSVDLRNLQVNLPASQVSAHGQFGAYPMTSPTGISVEFHSRDLDEFDTIFTALGLTRDGKTGTSALPIDLDGQADFKGTWTGSLVDPHLAGDLQASDLSVELPAKDKDGQPEVVHLDSLDATGSYSAARIAIDHGQIKHRRCIDQRGRNADRNDCAVDEIAGHSSVRHEFRSARKSACERRKRRRAGAFFRETTSRFRAFERAGCCGWPYQNIERQRMGAIGQWRFVWRATDANARRRKVCRRDAATFVGDDEQCRGFGDGLGHLRSALAAIQSGRAWHRNRHRED